MISRVASPAPRVPPATTGVPRSRRKAIGACASTPVLSSPWGASLLAPAASGAGLRSLSKDAPLPNFPASLGLHPGSTCSVTFPDDHARSAAASERAVRLASASQNVHAIYCALLSRYLQLLSLLPSRSFVPSSRMRR